MASSSRREPDGLLTSATHSKRCKEQGSEGDSTPFGAFALRYFAGRGPDNLIKLWIGHSQNSMNLYPAQIAARRGLPSRTVRKPCLGLSPATRKNVVAEFRKVGLHGAHPHPG
jgi:hypothetical protein